MAKLFGIGSKITYIGNSGSQSLECVGLKKDPLGEWCVQLKDEANYVSLYACSDIEKILVKSNQSE